MFSEQARGRSSGLLARNDVIFPSWFAVCFRSRRRWAWLLEGICVSIDTERTSLVPALDGEMHIFYLVHILSRVLNVPFNNDPGNCQLPYWSHKYTWVSSPFSDSQVVSNEGPLEPIPRARNVAQEDRYGPLHDR